MSNDDVRVLVFEGEYSEALFLKTLIESAGSERVTVRLKPDPYGCRAATSVGVSRSEPMSSRGNSALSWAMAPHTLRRLGEALGDEIPTLVVATTDDLPE